MAENKTEQVVMDVPEVENVSLPLPENTQDKAPLPTPPAAEDAATLSHLPENEQKSLQELKHLLSDALLHHKLSISTPPPPPPQNNQTTIAETLLEDVDGAKTLEAIEESIVTCAPSDAEEAASIWGVKLLEDERSDVILLKFLRARDFKVKDAFSMLDNTLKWRKEFGIDEQEEGEKIEDEELFERAVFMHGHSKEGHPVCYNVYGVFSDGELYEKIFDERDRFLRWRVRFMEKSVRNLDFRHGGISTIVQVNDLNNSPGPTRWELRQATTQAL